MIATCWALFERPRRSAIAGLLIVLPILLWLRPDAAVPVSARFVEGSLHGFLTLTTVDGKVIASGDLRQTVKAGAIENRTVFEFRDGSSSEETVTFTQHRVLSMQTYRSEQHGPAFNEDQEISLERASGKYRVKTRDHKDGKEKIVDGAIDLPPDVYNGMVFTVAKNLPESRGQSIHIVAFTPEPHVIALEILPMGKQKVVIGGLARTAIHYVLRPNLGFWLKLFTSLRGAPPVDDHVWILADPVPAFVRFEGPFYMSGPVWRIELTSPRWPD
jgi:hypothetical protein